MALNQYAIKTVSSESFEREEIVRFLSNFKNDKYGKDGWRSKLQSWWEKNPFYKEGLPRGWILQRGDNIVGFLGVIITDYLYQGNVHKALNMTTWRVAEEHRRQSIPLFLQFYNYRNENPLFVTTPNDTVVRVLQVFKFKSKTKIYNMIFPLGFKFRNNFFNFFHNLFCEFYKWWLPQGNCRPIVFEEEFKLKNDHGKLRNYLVKDKSSQYLNWLHSVDSLKSIVGYFDSNNELSSFVVLERMSMKDRDVLRVIDYFIGDSDGKEILSIIKYIIETPQFFDNTGYCRFLVLSEFPNNEIDIKVPFFVLRTSGKARMYYTLPNELENTRMLNYLAEGDFGLV